MQYVFEKLQSCVDKSIADLPETGADPGLTVAFTLDNQYSDDS